MAVNCTSSTQIPIQKYGSFLKYPNKELMSKRSFVPLKRAPVLRITASIKNKIYEDRSQGIVCYQDEHGEIICEGYDEGPCFQRIPEPTYHQRSCAEFRDAQITNLLLRQSWLQIAKGGNSNDAVEGVRLQEDINCNGFNSLC
ncbi:uncharacterized protein LOC113863713 isoform X1 [Abrus precatorius]|uniref:Uncharacterized protein LOC113863713 isoform X1 n=1 Tax=Abrus precatorius TaxID=3816 RepID=A0A8B8LAD3_ABRPR|nr:uncharacterized protein LOC113863713 isoform X1 [Abrus precatorius]